MRACAGKATSTLRTSRGSSTIISRNGKTTASCCGRCSCFRCGMRDTSSGIAQRSAAVDRWAAGALAVACTLILSFQLGRAPLVEPDEGRNAEVVRELQAAHDWITPHFNFIPYLDKPILFWWAAGTIVKFAGVSEWSVRVPSVLAALG